MVICWADISGYMAACWRALSAMPGVDLRVIAFASGQRTFSNELVADFNCQVIPQEQKNDEDLIFSLVRERQPEVLFTTGWFHRPYRKMIFSREYENIPKWIGVDTPWLATLKQQVGRVALRPLVRRADRIFVAGERAWQYMLRLGASEQKILRGLYGIDYDALSPLWSRRNNEPNGWPRRFLFIGRYCEQKAVDHLVEAYARYRKSVTDPWPLTCCGKGEMESLLAGREGIENFGFRQPGELPEIMRQHGVFVLPSRFDPWPLVVVESSAAGLPVICTERCGSAVELVRSYHNGITTAAEDPDAIADAMRWTHHHADQLPAMGARGRELASAYSAQMWATRWFEAAKSCLGRES